MDMENTIKKLRKAKGLTQEELGKACGKAKSYIAELESGKRNIAGVAAKTLVSIAQALGVDAEDIIDPPEELDDSDFEWEDVYSTGKESEYYLVVDNVIYSDRINKLIFNIDDVWYEKKTDRFNKTVPIDKQLRVIKVSIDDTNKRSYNNDATFVIGSRYVPRGGFIVNVEREITKSELEEIIEKYGLTEDDISNEFIDSKGDIYGPKYRKTFSAIQIRVPESEAIPLEKKLRNKGIEAFNVSPGRVNIRVK